LLSHQQKNAAKRWKFLSTLLLTEPVTWARMRFAAQQHASLIVDLFPMGNSCF
jgi:dihydroorotase